MAKYDIRTRDGRARRKANTLQFNPFTLQPHSKKFIEERKIRWACHNNKKGR